MASSCSRVRLVAWAISVIVSRPGKLVPSLLLPPIADVRALGSCKALSPVPPVPIHPTGAVAHLPSLQVVQHRVTCLLAILRDTLHLASTPPLPTKLQIPTPLAQPRRPTLTVVDVQSPPTQADHKEAGAHLHLLPVVGEVHGVKTILLDGLHLHLHDLQHRAVVAHLLACILLEQLLSKEIANLARNGVQVVEGGDSICYCRCLGSRAFLLSIDPPLNVCIFYICSSLLDRKDSFGIAQRSKDLGSHAQGSGRH